MFFRSVLKVGEKSDGGKRVLLNTSTDWFDRTIIISAMPHI